MKKLLSIAVLVLAFTGCASRTLIQEIAAGAASVAVVADPAIANYVTVALAAVNCATAPGTSAQVADGCLATALQNYQLAWQHASPKDQAVIQTLITAIEGIINDNAGGSGGVVAQGRSSAAKAQVHNSAVHAPTAQDFKQQFNAAAKTAGAKTI